MSVCSRSTVAPLVVLLVETHDEWQVSHRRYVSEASIAWLDPITDQRIRQLRLQAALLTI
jgi:hypothetical protein